MIVGFSLVINEVGVINPDSGWVEIFNLGSTPVNLNGFNLITKGRSLSLFGVINPGEYKVFYIGLSINSDSVVLKNGESVVDSYSWIGLPPQGSMGRYPDGIGDFRMFLVATPGRKNEIPSSLDEHSWGRIKALIGPKR